MSELIDRGAKALCDNACEGIPGYTWSAEPEGIKEHYRGMMRTALVAAREPTADMIFAGTKAVPSALEILPIWQAMADAALAP